MIGVQCTEGDGGVGYDLLVKNGKLSIGDTTSQNQALLLMSHKGDFKADPTVGVGLTDIVNDHDFASWSRSITEQFEADGQRIDKLSIDSKGITLSATYKDK